MFDCITRYYGLDNLTHKTNHHREYPDHMGLSFGNRFNMDNWEPRHIYSQYHPGGTMVSLHLSSFLPSPLLILSIARTIPYQTGCSIILFILQIKTHVQSGNLYNLLQAAHQCYYVISTQSDSFHTSNPAFNIIQLPKPLSSIMFSSFPLSSRS